MWESIVDIFTSGDIWSIIIKVLLTTLISGLLGLVGTLIGKIIIKNKDSKIYRYASTLVEAAEQKFPNEGIKMGPQKMEYVMSQLVIKFPKIADNQYLYNIAEAAVYKLNEDRQKKKLQEEFKTKYGEDPLEIEENKSEIEEESPQVAVTESTSKPIEKVESKNNKDTENKKDIKIVSF